MNAFENTKVLIIGSGPAGYTAAIYTSRALLEPILYEGMQPGGQLTTTSIVENYPGFAQGVDGNELMQSMRSQAENLGAQIRIGSVVSIDTTLRPFVVNIDDGTTIKAETIIYATGATAKYLDIPNEQKYRGAGVSACATCDGFFYKGLTVAVVGGGDTAAEDALYLSRIAKKVYLIVRRDVLRASQIMQKKLRSVQNIEILYKCQVVDIYGDNVVKQAVLKYSKGTAEEQERVIDVDGIFMAIGHRPNTDLLPEIEVDEMGYVVLKDGSTRTSIDGIFACGDVCDSNYRQAITAAASGCKAAIDVERWLNS